MNLHVALSVLLFFSAACYALMGMRLIGNTRAVGSVPIGVLFVVVGIWVMGGAIELVADSFVIFSLGRSGHFIGTALVPIVAYVGFREYTGRATSDVQLGLLLLVPIVSIALAASNAYHELMWHGPFVNDAGEFLTHPATWGPWFLYAHLPYSYLLISIAIYTLYAHSSAVAPAHRRGLYLLIAVCVVPLVATGAYDAGVGPDTVSYVPFVFTAMLPMYAWLMLGEQLIESTPLAYETVFQNMQDPVVVIDDQCCVIGLNHTAESMLSVNESQALREPLESLFGDEYPEVFEAVDTGAPQKMLTSTGRFLHVQVSPIKSARSPVQGGLVLMFRDVSDVERAQSEVRRSEKLLRTLIDHSANGIVRLARVADEQGGKMLRSVFANAAASRFLESTVDNIVGRPAAELVRRAATGMDEEETDAIVRRFIAAAEKGRKLEIEIRQGGRQPGRWLRVISEPIGQDIAVTIIDITDGKAKEQHMESIATSDPLTGVLNRRGFERDGARRLTQTEDDDAGALLFIDLNEFKAINDRHGHEVGDQLLVIVAARLKKSLRSCDIIGRPGGDEFVALVPDVDAAVADKLALRLTNALEAPYDIDGRQLICTASIGLALYPEHASTLTGLLREADQAMYRAKARSRVVTDIRGDDLIERAI